MLNRAITQQTIHTLSIFKQKKVLTQLAKINDFILYHDISENKLYLYFLTNAIATANFSETQEARIALLSNIRSNIEDNKQILFNLLQDYLSHSKSNVNLFYSDLSGGFVTTKEIKKCPYESNVMIKENTLACPTQVLLPEDFTIIVDKNELLKNLTTLRAYLLEHSNWAKNCGLTEELLAKRIKESTYTFILMNSKKECIGYISSITNDVATHIYNFSIHTQYRFQGLGTALMTALLNKIPKNHIIHLISAHAGPTMEHAKKLYEKFCFETYEKNSHLIEKVIALNIAQKPALECKI